MKASPAERMIGPALWLAFAATTAIYALLLGMAPRYALAVEAADRPILIVLALYTFAAGIYLAALWLALRQPARRSPAWWIIGTSFVYRLLLLPTPPFQEIDIYRYLWDGTVVIAGVDPYRYPPGQIVTAIETPATAKEGGQLQNLATLAQDSQTLEEILRTIHYAEYPSPYPPVSQVVFAAAAATSGDGWTTSTRLVWLKAWLTAFDLVTLLLVAGMLHMCAMHPGGAIAYGWSPLVMKEVAGSGHLDAIATCCAIAALACCCQSLRRRSLSWGVASSMLLGLGVGAKLFPVVLAPLVAAGLLKRLGLQATSVCAVVFLVVTSATLAPMLTPSESTSTAESPAATNVVSIPPPDASTPDSDGKTAGLTAFLKQWEMNDLIFMIFYENLRSQAGVPAGRYPWFDVTPESWNESLTGQDERCFLIVRLTTFAIYAVVVLGLAWRAARRLNDSPEALCGLLRAAFLTLAWFWLIAPTQNPWYWCWAIPLLPWAGCRAWLLVAPAAMAYYLRFWLEAHFPTAGVLGTPYNGEYFFYFVVPWLEFGPLLVWLIGDALLGNRPSVAPPTEPARVAP